MYSLCFVVDAESLASGARAPNSWRRDVVVIEVERSGHVDT